MVKRRNQDTAVFTHPAEAGFLLRMVQDGLKISLPQSRPMPDIWPRCHELKVRDENLDWRVVYRIDPDVILIVAVCPKKTGQTTKHDIDRCKAILKRYEADSKQAGRWPGR